MAERARELFIQARTDSQLQKVLGATRDLLADRYHRDQAALQQGNVTASTVSADLAVLADAETSLRQTQLDANLVRHQLNKLLGLQPYVDLHPPGAVGYGGEPSGRGMKATQIMAAQLRDLEAQLSTLEKTATAAEQSFRQGNLDAGLYVSLQSSVLAKQAGAIRLRASLDNAQSALKILLALHMLLERLTCEFL